MNDTDKQLEELLGAARWPDADDGAHERLAATWRGAIRRERVLRNLRTISRIAAVIAVVATVAVSTQWATRTRTLNPTALPAMSQKFVLVARPAEAPTAPRAAARQPTALERVMLDAQAKPRAVIKAVAPAPAVVTRPALDHLERRLSDPKLSADEHGQILRSLLVDGSPTAVRIYLSEVIDPTARSQALAAIGSFGAMPVDELIRCLNDPRVDVRIAAARTLGKIDGPVLTKRLAEMAERDENRREALMALASSDGAEAKAFVRQAAQRGPLASATRAVLSQSNLQ